MNPPTTSPAPDDITPTTPRGSDGGRAYRVTATGPVSVTVEDGRCVRFTIDHQTFVLVGSGVGELTDGQRVTITGHADPTMATTCQGGPAFVVQNLQTATN